MRTKTMSANFGPLDSEVPRQMTSLVSVLMANALGAMTVMAFLVFTLR